MQREDILLVIKKNAADVLSVGVEAIASTAKLSDLGANSMDRMEIVTMTMEALDVTFPLMALAGIDSVEKLARFFEEKIEAASARTPAEAGSP
jgi:polyketide biosynthesis acyl carrier protein